MEPWHAFDAPELPYSARMLPGAEAFAVEGMDPQRPAGPFYYAEDYHQQYLHKVPNGYCGLSGTGVTCPVGVL